ncbi:ThuA domain-containing protein [Chitinophaga caseinilytica]|uniref:ThuA domain-containing protein n=1 Tax=Chitinophaga caseinilytica TaxID=2267521 RepID=A0ABZ2Z5C6_9BACT
MKVKRFPARGILLISCLFLLTACASQRAPQGTVNWKQKKVLVFTKNGKGYVHDNIPDAAAAFKKMGTDHGFAVDVTDDASVFSESRLAQYDALVFTSTNNDVFDTDAQKVALMRYIQSGGGFMGVHSAIGTERKWDWFKRMIGGTFAWHAKFQRFRVVAVDPAHPSLKDVPKVWEREDECYFSKEMYGGIHPILAHDSKSLQDVNDTVLTKNQGSFGNYYPAAWYQHFDGGFVWFTSLGHHKRDYTDPVFVNHLYQGLHWLVGQTARRNPSKAYATSPETPVDYQR